MIGRFIAAFRRHHRATARRHFQRVLDLWRSGGDPADPDHDTSDVDTDHIPPGPHDPWMVDDGHDDDLFPRWSR